jgi:hypothetical protein
MRAPEAIVCFESSRTDLKCRACGESPSTIHIPTRFKGYFCEQCCPACRLRAAALSLEAWREAWREKFQAAKAKG